MDAVVLAGGVPQPDDPLYVYSKGDAKALIDVAGKPMIQWVLDALGEAGQVDNIVVVGLTAKGGLTSKKPLHFVSNQGRMLANIVAGIQRAMEISPQNPYVLVASADIPTLRPAMVDWLVNTALQTRDEFYYGVCPRAVMEKRFPASKRTYTKLADMEVCGADINVVHVRMISERLLKTWDALIGQRKSPLRSAAVIGFGLALRLRSGRLTLAEAVRQVSERLGVRGRAIIWEAAEPAMDADKPHQLELLRKVMERRVRASQPRPAKRVKPRKAPKRKATKPAKKAAARKRPAAKLARKVARKPARNTKRRSSASRSRRK